MSVSLTSSFQLVPSIEISGFRSRPLPTASAFYHLHFNLTLVFLQTCDTFQFVASLFHFKSLKTFFTKRRSFSIPVEEFSTKGSNQGWSPHPAKKRPCSVLDCRFHQWPLFITPTNYALEGRKSRKIIAFDFVGRL